MKKRGGFWPFVFFSLLCSTLVASIILTSQDATAAELVNTTHAKAEWYLYGHKVIPEEPKLEVRDGKEVVTVNGIQVFPTLPAPPPRKAPKLPALSPKLKAENQLLRQGGELKDSLQEQGLSDSDILQRIAEFYVASELVSSAEVVGATTIKLVYKDDPYPEYATFSFEPQLSQAEIRKRRVESEYRVLHFAWERSCLMVISSNTSYLFNPLNPDASLDEVRAEIQSIISSPLNMLNDGTWHGRFIDNARVARELRKPRPKVFLREE